MDMKSALLSRSEIDMADLKGETIISFSRHPAATLNTLTEVWAIKA